MSDSNTISRETGKGEAEAARAVGLSMNSGARPADGDINHTHRVASPVNGQSEMQAPIHTDEVVAIEGSPIAVTPETQPTTRPRFGPLRHRHFRNVWTGSIVSNTGGWMESVGVQWVVSHNSPHPMIAMGYLAVAQQVPTMVLGLYGGLIADRMNRKTLLLVTQAIMMFIAAALAMVSGMDAATDHVLLALATAQGVTLAFNMPAWQVLTPRLVPREDLTEAIALNGLQFNIARVIGPALAGMIMLKMTATALFVINTGTFLFVLAAVWSTPDSPAPPRENTSPWKQTADALVFVFREPGPRAAFLAMVVFCFFGTPVIRMLPVFAQQVYAAPDWLGREAIFGFMLAMMGVGAVVGVLALRKVPAWYPKHHLIPLSVLISGLFITGFAATTNLIAASIAMVVIGAFWLWTFNVSFSAMQLLVSERMRGRVMAVCNVAVFGAMAAGALVAGYIGEHVAKLVHTDHADAIGTQVGVGALSGFLALAGVVMLIWRTPEVDGLKPGDPGYDRKPGFWRGLTGVGHRPAS